PGADLRGRPDRSRARGCLGHKDEHLGAVLRCRGRLDRKEDVTVTDDTGRASAVASPDLPRAGSRARWSARLDVASIVEKYALVLAWGIVVLVFSLLPKTADYFPTTSNF